MFIVGMSRVSTLMNHSVETIVFVSGVLNGSDGTIRVIDGVGPLHYISIPVLMGRLDVACLMILNTVLVLVLGMSLRQ